MARREMTPAYGSLTSEEGRKGFISRRSGRRAARADSFRPMFLSSLGDEATENFGAERTTGDGMDGWMVVAGPPPRRLQAHDRGFRRKTSLIPTIDRAACLRQLPARSPHPPRPHLQHLTTPRVADPDEVFAFNSRDAMSWRV